MGISKIHTWEKAVIAVLNILGWELEWTGEKFDSWDAKGKTPKGFPCVIEMKFRNKYYEEKLLEKSKYDALMKLPEDIVKIYFVNDPQANYMFWLNKLEMPNSIKLYCPDTSFWTKKRLKKEVYLLRENQASRINLNNN